VVLKESNVYATRMGRPIGVSAFTHAHRHHRLVPASKVMAVGSRFAENGQGPSDCKPCFHGWSELHKFLDHPRMQTPGYLSYPLLVGADGPVFMMNVELFV
jgi:hypothetical protein